MAIPRSCDHRVLVGAGVSGLTSALCLARAGFEVEVVAERFAPDVVSVVAGALWEWPPAVCGHHRDQSSLARSKDWCMVSYEIFDDLGRDRQTGVFMRTANFYFRHRLEDRPRELRKMWELAPRVRGFVRDVGLAYLNGVDSGAGIRDAYAHLAPMIDRPVHGLASQAGRGCRGREPGSSPTTRTAVRASPSRGGCPRGDRTGAGREGGAVEPRPRQARAGRRGGCGPRAVPRCPSAGLTPRRRRGRRQE
ncbi:MAG: hypothetical protein QOG45_2711 [Chloroflexota bacterium]|jgi:glycine/D-amino acid oxidase-like deaminating enzyme|nr:hypothetical protein [Chloroflexota bacterium]